MKTYKSKKHPERTGLAEPKMDFFTDVNRALSSYLMRTDASYAKASADAKARNKRRRHEPV